MVNRLLDMVKSFYNQHRNHLHILQLLGLGSCILKHEDMQLLKPKVLRGI